MSRQGSGAERTENEVSHFQYFADLRTPGLGQTPGWTTPEATDVRQTGGGEVGSGQGRAQNRTGTRACVDGFKALGATDNSAAEQPRTF